MESLDNPISLTYKSGNTLPPNIKVIAIVVSAASAFMIFSDIKTDFIEDKVMPNLDKGSFTFHLDDTYKNRKIQDLFFDYSLLTVIQNTFKDYRCSYNLDFVNETGTLYMKKK